MRNWKLMKRPAAIALLLALVIGAAGAALATEPGTYAAALKEAEATNKLVVVDFYTDW